MTQSTDPHPTDQRVFKTPLLVALLPLLLAVIFIGYALLAASGQSDSGWLRKLKPYSFILFILCEIGMVGILLINLRLVRGFLSQFPEINNRHALKALKPLVRTNMISALLMMVLLILGSLATIMSIMNAQWQQQLVILVLVWIPVLLMQIYNRAESQLKHIQAATPELDTELAQILDTWHKKTFPDF